MLFYRGILLMTDEEVKLFQSYELLLCYASDRLTNLFAFKENELESNQLDWQPAYSLCLMIYKNFVQMLPSTFKS